MLPGTFPDCNCSARGSFGQIAFGVCDCFFAFQPAPSFIFSSQPSLKHGRHQEEDACHEDGKGECYGEEKANEFEKKEEEMNELQSKLKNAQQEVDTVQESLQEAIVKLEETDKRATNLSEKSARCTRFADMGGPHVVDCVKAKIDALKKEQDRLEQELITKTDDIKIEIRAKEAAEAEVAAMTRRIRLLEEDFEQSSGRLTETSTKLEDASKAAEESERNRKTLETKSISDDERINQLEDQTKEAKNIAEDAERKYDEAARRLAITEVDLERAESRLESSEGKIVELEEELRIVGNNMKLLEVSEQESAQREESYEETIRDLTERLKAVSFRARSSLFGMKCCMYLAHLHRSQRMKISGRMDDKGLINTELLASKVMGSLSQRPTRENCRTYETVPASFSIAHVPNEWRVLARLAAQAESNSNNVLPVNFAVRPNKELLRPIARSLSSRTKSIGSRALMRAEAAEAASRRYEQEIQRANGEFCSFCLFTKTVSELFFAAGQGKDERMYLRLTPNHDSNIIRMPGAEELSHLYRGGVTDNSGQNRVAAALEVVRSQVPLTHYQPVKQDSACAPSLCCCKNRSPCVLLSETHCHLNPRFKSDDYYRFLDELLLEKERYRGISGELDTTFAELTAF
ncbi:unnamed protein product [Schistocephalus solidus]|uniref:Tropomyosin n=1 Tax=Schistocephalus solidus TaxID=70667 RepID=A0A183SE08_SCHSO|nr:unnamed protein product [Schistocephalus solidus]